MLSQLSGGPEAPAGPIFVFDAGNALWKSATISADESAAQQRKSTLIAAAYRLGGIDAMGVGEGELAFGLPWLQQVAKDHALPLLSANLECGGQKPFPASLVVERGGLRVGVIALTGNGVKATAPEQGACVATDPAAALPAAIAALPATDLRVVLSSLSPEETKRLIHGLSDPSQWLDFVIMGQGRRELATPETLSGGALLLGPGSRGKKLGILEFDAAGTGHSWRDTSAMGDLATRKDSMTSQIAEVEGRLKAPDLDPQERRRLETRLSYYQREREKITAQLAAMSDASAARPATHRFQELSAEVPDHPATAELVTAAKAEVEALAGTAAPYSGPFVGSAKCAACHPAEAAQWATTPHARAYASLQADNRAKDPACYACHVTGAHHPDGPKSPAIASDLENVGCESCHGPGRDHAQTPGQVDMIRRPDSATCTACHDGVKDEGRFDEAAYWPRIVHAAPAKPEAPAQPGAPAKPPG